jgi:hypothetical protein
MDESCILAICYDPGPNFSFSYHTAPLAPPAPTPVAPAAPTHHTALPLPVPPVPQPATQLQPHQLHHQPAPALPHEVSANPMTIDEHPPKPYQGAAPVYEGDHQSTHSSVPRQQSPARDIAMQEPLMPLTPSPVSDHLPFPSGYKCS